ncbi:MAG: hypothetical protein HYT93_00250 [Parcubacteria group bacterium]|nr:hypothetical protein [Parcubacteria group bacterium]
MLYIRNQKGFLRLILLIIIVIIVLSYFNIDIRGIIEAPQTQSNLQYVWGFTVTVWQEYLRSPVLYFWNNIFINLLWESFVSNLERIKAGQSHDFELNAPQVP